MAHTSNKQERPTAPIALRIVASEHAEIARLSRMHDRTPSGEVRRAIRYYLRHFDAVDRSLRHMADSGRDGE